MHTEGQEKLIKVIQVVFSDSAEPVALVEDEVKELMRIASRQSIQYIVITGIKKLGYENLLAEDTENLVAKASFDYIQRREALKEISQALESDSIDYIPLKGAVLRDLYPNPCMRSSSDIDVLVRQGDLVPAIDALEERTSFVYYKNGHHDVHLKNQRLHLELHFSLMTNIEKLDGVLQKAWQYAHKTGEGSCLAFSPEYQLFYITAHAAKHFIKEGGVGIRPLLDIWMLRAKTRYNADEVRALCEEAGILGFYDMCCNLLDAWFNDGAYSEATKDFEDIVFSGGVFGSDHIMVVAQGRKYSGAKYVVKRVFRSSKDIKELYPVCERHPSLVPFYQAVRWTRLFKGSKRAAVRKELLEARALDPAEVEKYDRLMKTMGL